MYTGFFSGEGKKNFECVINFEMEELTSIYKISKHVIVTLGTFSQLGSHISFAK